jgi:hypothetical protein
LTATQTQKLTHNQLLIQSERRNHRSAVVLEEQGICHSGQLDHVAVVALRTSPAEDVGLETATSIGSRRIEPKLIIKLL